MRTAISLLFVFSVLLAPTTVSGGASSEWVVVIDAPGRPNGLLGALPVDPTYDPRADIERVSVRDEGGWFAVRFETATEDEGSGSASSDLTLDVISSFIGGGRLAIEAVDDQFTFRYELPGADGATRKLDPEEGIVMAPGSTAWAYEVRFRRDLFFEDGSYIRGDELNYFLAEADASHCETVTGACTRDRAQQDPWGEAVDLRKGGGYPLDTFAQRSMTAWYPYYVHADGVGTSVGTDDSGRVHVAYQLREADAYHERIGDPLGIYHVEVVDGVLEETFVGSAVPSPDLAGYEAQVAIAVVGKTPHIVYHPQPGDRSSSGRDALVHAWRAGDVWESDHPLEGLAVGPVLVDHRSILELVGSGDRLVTAVRPADGSGLVLLDKHGVSPWQVLHRLPGADFARVRLDVKGDLHVAAYYQDPEAEPGVESYSRLAYLAEATGFVEVPIAERVLDHNEASNTTLSPGSFDMALRPDGTPCFLLWNGTAYYSPQREEGGVFFQCGVEEPLLREPLPFLFDPQSPLLWVRLEFAPTGHAVAQAGYAGVDWVGIRDPTGKWWWEAMGGKRAPDIAALPDGRAVMVYRGGGGFSETSLFVQHPNATEDLSRWFFVGTAEEARVALRPYRELDRSDSTGEGATAPPRPADPIGAASVPADRSDRDTPGIAGAVVVGMLALLVRRGGRRRNAVTPR